MKSISNLPYKWLFLLFIFTAAVPAMAQEKDEEIKALLENKEYVFKAQTASPLRGRTIQLTSEYDVLISADSVRTFLPYFGRAYMAQPYNNDGGIKITTTDFKYTLNDKKKKRWIVVIEPSDKNEVQQLHLSISKSGYATLQVVSTNRDPITFNGYITSRK